MIVDKPIAALSIRVPAQAAPAPFLLGQLGEHSLQSLLESGSRTCWDILLFTARCERCPRHRGKVRVACSVEPSSSVDRKLEDSVVRWREAVAIGNLVSGGGSK